MWELLCKGKWRKQIIHTVIVYKFLIPFLQSRRSSQGPPGVVRSLCSDLTWTRLTVVTLLPFPFITSSIYWQRMHRHNCIYLLNQNYCKTKEQRTRKVFLFSKQWRPVTSPSVSPYFKCSIMTVHFIYWASITSIIPSRFVIVLSLKPKLKIQTWKQGYKKV